MRFIFGLKVKIYPYGPHIIVISIITIFKVKGKKDEKDKENESKKKMTEIEELKHRLAKTEEALNKLVQATTQD